jgi:hypothetical protein
MRTFLLVAILLSTAACGAYRFPGPANGTGNVHGQVVAVGCGGPVQPDAGPCIAKPSSGCPAPPVNQSCDSWPVPGIALMFSNGTVTFVAKTDSAGAYSVDLPVGTWRVGTANFARIVDGPQTIVVADGGSIEADYVVDTGIRAAA